MNGADIISIHMELILAAENAPQPPVVNLSGVESALRDLKNNVDQEFDRLKTQLRETDWDTRQQLNSAIAAVRKDTLAALNTTASHLLSANYQLEQQIYNQTAAIDDSVTTSERTITNGQEKITDLVVENTNEITSRLEAAKSSLEADIDSITGDFSNELSNTTDIIQLNLQDTANNLKNTMDDNTIIINNNVEQRFADTEATIKDVEALTWEQVQAGTSQVRDDIAIVDLQLKEQSNNILEAVSDIGLGFESALALFWDAIRSYLDDNFTPDMENLTNRYELEYIAQSLAQRNVQEMLGG